MAKKKVLLMGKAHSGKTSMRSIIFANYLARDTTRLSPTLDVEHHHVRFLGDLVLNLWDCGGQDAFYESYFERDRETIFRGVELLIYVFDIESETPEKDFDHFCGVLEAIEENSPDARIFLLIHKMDLVAEEDRDAILEDRKRLIEESCLSCGVENFQCFGTSIWDETLYKAWSEIVTNLIPNIRLLETHLQKFCRICDADEVVLFERATFLVISHAQGSDDDDPQQAATTATTELSQTSSLAADHGGGGGGGADSGDTLDGTGSEIRSASVDAASATATGSFVKDNANQPPPTSVVPAGAAAAGGGALSSSQGTNNTPRHVSRCLFFDDHRFEKISNIIKQFKLSCGKAQSQFQGMQVQNSRFTAYIDQFTANTFILVIVSNPMVKSAATTLNIQNARDHFERFIPRI
mmetsp:Transcript_28323/g.68891  ORF Transcript_28323/g.68891 Transcript_28323/m.68891 type:complete len:409 (-) Transcript_28323:224-1450(-)